MTIAQDTIKMQDLTICQMYTVRILNATPSFLESVKDKFHGTEAKVRNHGEKLLVDYEDTITQYSIEPIDLNDIELDESIDRAKK